MATKIRLQRHGRKKRPFYWIIVADSRSKRDGKFIEKLGVYNPMTNPAIVEIDLDATVKWLHNGAQPTETARRLLSYKGVLLKHHLEVGRNKGALTQEQVDEKISEWLKEKGTKVESKSHKLEKDKESSKAKKIQSEKEYREKQFSPLPDSENDSAIIKEEPSKTEASSPANETKLEEDKSESSTKIEEKIKDTSEKKEGNDKAVEQTIKNKKLDDTSDNKPTNAKVTEKKEPNSSSNKKENDDKSDGKKS